MGGTPRSTLLINVGVVVLIAVGLWAAFKSSGSDSAGPPPTPEEQAAALTASSSLAAPGTDDETAIRATVTRYVTRSEPADCRRVFTQSRIDRAFEGSGRKAIDDCRGEASENGVPDADEAVIQSVSIMGNRATAVVGGTGGTFDGRVDTLKLVRAGGRWKINAIAKVEIDRKLYDQSNQELLVERGFTPREASCVIRVEKDSVSTKELERAVVTGKDDLSSEKDDDRVRSCLGATTLKRVFLKHLREGARLNGYPPSLFDCATRRLVRGMNEAELRAHAFGDESPSDAQLTAVYTACARDY